MNEPPQKRKRKIQKASQQRPRTDVNGLVLGNIEELAKTNVNGLVLGKIEELANDQNSKAKRTQTRRDQTPFSALQSMVAKSTKAAASSGKKNRKKKTLENSADAEEDQVHQSQDVHEILLGKSSSIPEDDPLEKKKSQKPISLVESDAQLSYQTIDREKKKQKTKSSNSGSTVSMDSISIFPSDTTRPWIETLVMLSEVKATNLPAEIQFDQTERAPPNTRSFSQAASSSSSSGRAATMRHMDFGANGELNCVWLADSASIGFYLQRLVNFSDEHTSESLRRALRRPELSNSTDPHLCPREHVDRVLCCPYEPFRPCAMGDKCIAKAQYHLLPKPLMEYVSPKQYEDIMNGRDSRPMGYANFCYICLLYYYDRAHHYSREKGQSVSGVNPEFYHIVGPGEYHHQDMIENLTGAVDTPADKPMVNCSVTGFENCGGLVTALRKFSVFDYRADSAKRVTVPAANKEPSTLTVFGLKETTTEFVKHASTKNDPDPLDPYIRLKHIITHRPDMWEIMQYYFSTSNRTPSIGISRLRNAHPQAKKDVVTVAIYWGVTSPHSHISNFANRLVASGFEPFPFQWVFCEDITVTEEHLEEILRGGRIHLSYLQGQEEYREVMNHVVNIDEPINVFSDAIRTHPFFASRRLLAAYYVRQQVFATLLSMYPSNTPYNDASIHRRLSIMHTWNENQYGYLAEEKPLDDDVQLRAIDPLPFHFFASDIDFFKVRTEVVLSTSPREYLLCHFGEHPAFLEFSQMRRMIRDRHIDREEAVSLWKNASVAVDGPLYFEHPYMPEELVDESVPNYILYELLCDRYSVLWTLMIRLNYVHDLAKQEEKRLAILEEDFQNIEERFLSQPDQEEIEEALEVAANENNQRAASRIRATINNLSVSREKVEECRRVYLKQQELVYQIYCYLYTHLPLVERSVDLSLLKDTDFFQPSPVIPSAEAVVLESEMRHYQGRPFSICENPMRRLSELLTFTRQKRPKLVSRVVNHYPHLFIHPVTGFVETHTYQMATSKKAFSIFSVEVQQDIDPTVVDTEFLSALSDDKRPYYKFGQSKSTQQFNLNVLRQVRVYLDDETGNTEIGYKFADNNLVYFRDPEVSVRIAEKGAAESLLYDQRLEEIRENGGDEDDAFEVFTKFDSHIFFVYKNGRLLDEQHAERKGLNVFNAIKVEYAIFEKYPTFPHDPAIIDPFAHKIQYHQQDLDEYFSKFLNGFVTCLNTSCLPQERQHLARFYIELRVDKESQKVKQSPVNFGKIRQVSTPRQYEILEKLLEDAPNQVITHYTECYPDDRRTIHEGMLPNMTSIIGCINFVDDNSAEPKSNTRQPAAIIYMLRKMYPKCCQSRKKNEKHIVACKDNISYLMLVRECFLVTMLGAYRHATKRPGFMKALGIFKLMRSHFNVEKFYSDQKRFPSLFTFCVTEALMLWTRSALAYYHYIISRYPIYVRFEKTVHIKADRIREMFGNGHSIRNLDDFIDERELFATEPKGASSASSSSSASSLSSSQTVKNHVYRRTCFNPIYVLRSMMTDILNQPKYARRPEMPKILRKAITHRVYSLEPNTDIDMISILSEFNAFHPPGVVPKVCDLNIQPCTEVILLWVLKLMANAAPEDSIKELLELMPPRDMEIFDLFINTLAQHYSINIFKLPEFMRQQQELALKFRFGMHNPSVASGSLIVTTCCGQKKTYDSRENSKSAHLHYGSRLMALDMRDGYKVFCCSKKDADIERKNTRMRKELAKEVERAVITGKSKEEISLIIHSQAPEWKAYASYRYQPKCGESPAQIYSLIGNVIQIADSRGITNAFTICVNCGSVCGFSRRMYDINWFSCMTCERDHVLKMRTPRCVACHNFLKFDKNGNTKWHKFMAFNDSQVPVTYTFDMFHVCDRCYGTKTSYFRSDIIYTTSELRSAKYASDQRAVFDLREGNIDIHDVIDHYHENLEIKLHTNKPKRGAASSESDDDDADDLKPRKSKYHANDHLLTKKARRRQRLLRSGPEPPYDTNSNYYGNLRSVDNRQGDNNTFSNFSNLFDSAIFPSSLTDADTFRLNMQLQS